MVEDTYVNRGFYWTVKDKVWKAFGITFYKKRDTFLVDLLNRIKDIALVENTPNAKILDVGCGTGDITGKLSEIYDTETVGVDLSNRFKYSGPVFLIANCSKLPFKHKSFSIITAFSVIEHIEENRRKVRGLLSIQITLPFLF